MDKMYNLLWHKRPLGHNDALLRHIISNWFVSPNFWISCTLSIGCFKFAHVTNYPNNSSVAGFCCTIKMAFCWNCSRYLGTYRHWFYVIGRCDWWKLTNVFFLIPEPHCRTASIKWLMLRVVVLSWWMSWPAAGILQWSSSFLNYINTT